MHAISNPTETHQHPVGAEQNPAVGTPRKPANALKVTFIAEDFDAVDLEVVALFEENLSVFPE